MKHEELELHPHERHLLPEGQLLYGSIVGFFYTAVAAAQFVAAYLNEAGYSGTQVGTIMSVLNVLGIPEETGLLLLLRPLSGSAALAAAGDIMAQYGADSLIGRTAAVMTGASETTLYVVAVYLAGAGVKDSRWAIPAALCADLVCFLSSAWICSLLWG